MAERLRGTSVFITGGASGIGHASAQLFAREGARVVVADINAEAGEAVADTCRSAGGDASFVHCDVTDEAAVADAVGRSGGVEVLYNCAGGSTNDDAAVDSLSMETLAHTMKLELQSVMLCSRAVLPQMIERGSGVIINMASFVAFRGVFDIHAYIAAKGAIVALTRAMAGKYARNGIRVNAIAPGIALSERAAARIRTGNITGNMPFRWEDYPFAMGSPEDIANVALFLASSESRMITGQTIVADGGLSAY